MGRSLSLPQIHQKITCMWGSFHKITSDCWKRTPGTQTGKPCFRIEVGQRIKMKRGTEHLQMETHRGEGVMKEKFPHNSKLCHRGSQWATLESQRTT